ncbi:MAG: GNAT family N-acetyltransferase [Kurthia sp.]|nr:GNAT family N-acetyltransferase [Candidatus Kurthia equi]
MRINELTLEHATIYRNMRLKALREEPYSFTEAYEDALELSFTEYENDLLDENRITFGAFEEDVLVAIVTLETTKKKKRAHIAQIVEMYVHSDYRGQGLSKPIMASAIMRAKELKCEQIHLTVNIANTRAKTLYTSFGFEIIGMEKEILKVSENKYIDEYRMALYFDEWVEE